MERGLIDADLGAGVVKKRVPLPGKGKRGSARTLIATNLGTRWFFLFGFEKSEQSNITKEELSALQTLAKDWLSRADSELDNAIQDGSLKEICHEH